MINQYYQYEGERLANKVKAIQDKLPITNRRRILSSKMTLDNVLINIIGEHHDDESNLMFLITFDIENNNIEAHVAIGGAPKEDVYQHSHHERLLLDSFNEVFLQEGFTIYD
ncbi:hypothetical protein M2475_001291 [Breznakia sp. PF5-3]|uniref:hypothetical protein n=1 Tax=unclassified Breznakia TaxID=2623764 RepID=UPI00240604ED|nr:MULTISPECIES: hypothetical protein [unclassified Breznakia]MDF9824865.1 hypothetical protein [Breznakia sp. PM6-1]MDF9835722.1 hypothetical protein [Breznakia sp. PF5-3]MDF9838282.1 hypothetical protein [Breznakia sp. PFB2-8]MDF9860279.1 hypothetical protein [Breznakia sp. PH5-24]